MLFLLNNSTKKMINILPRCSKSLFSLQKYNKINYSPFMMNIRYFCEINTVNKDLEEKIMEILRAALEKSPKAKPDLLDRTKSFEEMGLDSLDTVDLIVELEEQLGVDITNEEAEDKIKTPADAINVFGAYLNK